jgi:hypothetical protein
MLHFFWFYRTFFLKPILNAEAGEGESDTRSPMMPGCFHALHGYSTPSLMRQQTQH